MVWLCISKVYTCFGKPKIVVPSLANDTSFRLIQEGNIISLAVVEVEEVVMEYL